MRDNHTQDESAPFEMDPESRAIIHAFAAGRIPIDRYEDLFGQVLDDAKRWVESLGTQSSPSILPTPERGSVASDGSASINRVVGITPGDLDKFPNNVERIRWITDGIGDGLAQMNQGAGLRNIRLRNIVPSGDNFVFRIVIEAEVVKA